MYDINLGRTFLAVPVMGIAAGLAPAGVLYLLWIYVFSHVSISFS